MSRAQIEREAERILAQVGITKPIVKPFDVASSMGLNIGAAKLEKGTTGVLVRNAKGGPAIRVNRDFYGDRRAWTYAVLIGHFVVHPKLDVVVMGRGLTMVRDASSVRAEQFAAALLMPKLWLAREVVGLDLHGPAPQRIAKKFGVSVAMLGWRIAGLGGILDERIDINL